MFLAVAVFVVGSAIQCGAVTVPMLFVGMSLKQCNHRDRSKYLQEERSLALPLDS
jgi:hypothetical protein